jgi:hemoglobin
VVVSLYEFAGGHDAILALARAHHARCLADPELDHPFSNPDQHPHHVERLAAYWAEALGGPAEYSRDLGSHAGVVSMHSGNGDITDLNRRFLACFLLAMDDAGLPADPAFRAALESYMRWATRDVSGRADGDAIVPAGTPVPRWDWDGPR